MISPSATFRNHSEQYATMHTTSDSVGNILEKSIRKSIPTEVQGSEREIFVSSMRSPSFIITYGKELSVQTDLEESNFYLSFLESLFNEKTSFSFLAFHLKQMGLVDSAGRIEELASLQDCDDGEKPLSIESTQGFQKFVLQFMELGEPLLGVFPAGTLSAEWRIDSNKHLLMEFLDIDTISFAMIGPDEKSSDGKFRLNGRANREEVIKILFERGVEKWPK